MRRNPARIGSAAGAILTAILLLLPTCSPRRAAGRWRAATVATDATFSGIWFSDSLSGWVTGGGWAIDGGIVGRTRDGGRTWRFRSGVLSAAGKGSGLACVQFLDSLHGCVAAPDQRVLVTDDGGESWRPVRTTGPGGGNLFDIQFIDASNGWAAGTLIARTEDGGETWRTLTHSTAENGYLSANAIHFLDGARGWLVSHGGALMRSDDGGVHWTPVALPLRPGERPTLRDITFSDSLHGWVVGERGSIFRTQDGGSTWTLQEDGVPVVRAIPRNEPARPRDVVPELETEPDRLAITAVGFADSARGWAVGSYADVAESVVLRTGDGGASWKVEHVVPGEMLQTLFVLDANHAWAAGDRARKRPQVILRYSHTGR